MQTQLLKMSVYVKLTDSPMMRWTLQKFPLQSAGCSGFLHRPLSIPIRTIFIFKKKKKKEVALSLPCAQFRAQCAGSRWNVGFRSPEFSLSCITNQPRVAFRRRNSDSRGTSRRHEETRCTASLASNAMHACISTTRSARALQKQLVRRFARLESLSIPSLFLSTPEEKPRSLSAVRSRCRSAGEGGRGRPHSVVAGSETSSRRACKFGRKKKWNERTDVRALTYGEPWQQTDQ